MRALILPRCPGAFCTHGCPGWVDGAALGGERALFPFLTKVTGRAKGWGGLGGLKEMAVILPRKLSWGNDQLGGSSSVPAITFIPTALQQDPALQALATPSPSPSHQQNSSRQPAGARSVFHPKPHLIIGLNSNTSSRVKYRLFLLAGDGHWVFTE